MRRCGIAFGLAVILSALVTATGTHAAVAPRELAFVAGVPGNPRIFIIRADGSVRRRLTSVPSTTPVWSPDGRRVVCIRYNGDDTQIAVVNADGGPVRPLTPGRGRARSPAWSPDGAQIVFTDTRDGVSRIALMRPDGSQRHDLAPSPRDQRAPAWSPDGRLIAFLSRTEGGYFGLYVIGADGQHAQQVPAPAPGVEPEVKDFSWLPDGRLAYTSHSGPAQDGFTVTSISGADRRYLGGGSSPMWSPDGRRLAFVASHSGATQIYVQDSAEGRVARVSPRGLTSVRPVWAPDSRQLAFLSLERGTVTLTVIDANGGHARRLAGDVYGDLSAPPLVSWRPR